MGHQEEIGNSFNPEMFYQENDTQGDLEAEQLAGQESVQMGELKRGKTRSNYFLILFLLTSKYLRWLPTERPRPAWPHVWWVECLSWSCSEPLLALEAMSCEEAIFLQTETRCCQANKNVRNQNFSLCFSFKNKRPQEGARLQFSAAENQGMAK